MDKSEVVFNKLANLVILPVKDIEELDSPKGYAKELVNTYGLAIPASGLGAGLGILSARSAPTKVTMGLLGGITGYSIGSHVGTQDTYRSAGALSPSIGNTILRGLGDLFGSGIGYGLSGLVTKKPLPRYIASTAAGTLADYGTRKILGFEENGKKH